ncbi:hypothetical protein [Microbacterium sp. BH-3-3-3]|uniref:hypothetical protein n=1 Tax=Microbacterium sp. BH-3-3-3 TaxID=1906742 RepID=UPI00089286A2|nr:hypothetical protein [Microbacterium sp. BH-3-3-3]AOX46708.1 hypothetical protein BJP65_13640 [Microbacterium sp. BH-3-3-3]
MSVRQQVADLLIELLTANEALPAINVVATERILDEVRDLTIQLRSTSIGRLPQAPISQRVIRMNAIVISGHDDPDMAVDELEDIVPLILDSLDTSFQHEDAELVQFGTRMAYSIPLTVIAAKE